jgi:hypothetical protein
VVVVKYTLKYRTEGQQLWLMFSSARLRTVSENLDYWSKWGRSAYGWDGMRISRAGVNLMGWEW